MIVMNATARESVSSDSRPWSSCQPTYRQAGTATTASAVSTALRWMNRK
jgi:hypothetical protein